jgi:hypothetical protein
MKIILYLSILTLFGVYACEQAPETTKETALQKANSQENTQKDEKEAGKNEIDTTNYSRVVLADGTIMRYSSDEGQSWDSASVIQISGLEESVKKGIMVYVVPEDNSLPIITSAISSVVMTENTVEEQVPMHEVGSIRNNTFLKYGGNPELRPEYLGTALILPSLSYYPERLDVKDLAKSDLPKDIYKHNIKFAVDLNEDKHPDIIVSYFCCKDPSKKGFCDYSCSNIYRKNKGKWEVEVIPMGC